MSASVRPTGAVSPVTGAPSGSSGDSQRETLIGIAAAFLGFVLWGIAPIYFKWLDAVPPLEIFAHRVVWSVILLAGIVVLSGRLYSLWGRLSAAPVWVYLACTLLIAANWFIYIWAIAADRLLEASLGYFINPLVNVLLGVLFLSERLLRRQAWAVGLAAIGVLNLVIAQGVLPWVALSLALTFGFYALLRKKYKIDPVGGLLVETALLAPLAVLYLGWLGAAGQGAFLTAGPGIAVLLMLAGAVTTVPLLLFMAGTRRLRLATVGLMQYIAPTLQFLIAVLLFREPFTAAHLVTFLFIWAGLALYSWESVRAFRAARRQAA